MRPPASVQGRLRLRPWLEQQIQSGRYPGVSWLDQSAGVFQIPWKHAARHGWSIDRDASLFRSWAMYTGLSSGLSLGAQGWEAAVKLRPDPQSSSCVPLDRFPDVFCSSRGLQEDGSSGSFQARARESLPPYCTIKQEEATTAEQISYCSSSSSATAEQITSSFHLLPQASSCTPHTQRIWDSPSVDQEQTEAVFKIVDQLSSSDWGQSGEPRCWRPPGSFWEDCFSGDLDPLTSDPGALQADSYWPCASLRAPVEACTPGLSQ
ncbi:interferon regulatory factor 1-like isoform X2 [Hypomesus transpacificus]|uniref:interferon regulatory factor 1-like isoform X2 n=1 Tax=Hypomesus transpacificus TaxID=137520 RepID=UPI001F074486|nr:interferon regulatory factor 1-like isoform X2 [Hypomesus transpacificus]